MKNTLAAAKQIDMHQFAIQSTLCGKGTWQKKHRLIVMVLSLNSV